MKKNVYFVYCMLFFYSIVGASESNVLHAPILFTQSGLHSFFKETFNSSSYRQEVLPNNFSHLGQLIEHGLNRRQGRAYTQSIMRLFNNALKGSMYTNAYAFSDCIEKLIPLLHKQCVLQESDPTRIMKTRIDDILYENFLNKCDLFKKDPGVFIESVSNSIALCAQDSLFLGGDISCHEFRKIIVSFFEQALGKLVWNPQDGINTWRNVKQIAQSIEKLLDQKILTDEDDVNDLCISLIERYCLFIDINAPQFSVDCYKEIRNEVLAQNLYFLELDEQEPFLEKKSQRMMRALLDGEAKARAVEYGIITT